MDDLKKAVRIFVQSPLEIRDSLISPQVVVTRSQFQRFGDLDSLSNVSCMGIVEEIQVVAAPTRPFGMATSWSLCL
jgi:hypothetical protein